MENRTDITHTRIGLFKGIMGKTKNLERLLLNLGYQPMLTPVRNYTDLQYPARIGKTGFNRTWIKTSHDTRPDLSKITLSIRKGLLLHTLQVEGTLRGNDIFEEIKKALT